MARPTVDKDMMRKRFVHAAESVLRRNGGTELVLADVAAFLGMSQSNSYRYFRDRRALVTMLAENWFQDVEGKVATAVAAQQTKEKKILHWVLATMQAKCSKFDADPVLFAAYLNLAKGEEDAVARHMDALRTIIWPAMAELAGQEQAAEALLLLEDATILFRNPYLIAQNRSTLSETRATQITAAVVQKIAKQGLA